MVWIGLDLGGKFGFDGIFGFDGSFGFNDSSGLLDNFDSLNLSPL